MQAFDSLTCEILIDKLSHHGVRGEQLCCRLCQKYDSRIASIATFNKHEELITFANDSSLGAPKTSEDSFTLRLQTMTEEIYYWFDNDLLAMNVKNTDLIILPV